ALPCSTLARVRLPVVIPCCPSSTLCRSFAVGRAALLVETVEEFTGLPIDLYVEVGFDGVAGVVDAVDHVMIDGQSRELLDRLHQDRKSTRLHSSHVSISYAVFCL